MTSTRLLVTNHRGKRVPAVLGLALTLALVAGSAVVAVSSSSGMTQAGWISVAATVVVAAAGLVDDLAAAGGPRGIRGHLRALAGGHVTTGMLKLVVAVGAGIVVVAANPVRPAPVRLAGVVLIPACANLWNGLDVAPGRALKAFLVVDGAVLGVDRTVAPGVATLWLAAIAAIGFDLREIAMLGDSGANLLGFTAGIGLYAALPGWGVAVAAAGALALNVCAEYIGLSSIIDGNRMLRAIDRLGRLPSAPADPP
jgi:UDP-GlcNAc:undecaprenyl-phosphate/decaprenyl-phosphate GlcNAc-1-phosphate transferase